MRKGLLAVVREIFVHMPGLAKVIRTLDVHGRWPEGGEHNNHVSEVEFGLEVQLDGHILLPVLRLPPRLLQRSRLVLVDNLTDPVVLQRIVLRTVSSVAQEALGLLQM